MYKHNVSLKLYVRPEEVFAYSSFSASIGHSTLSFTLSLLLGCKYYLNIEQ